LSVWGVFWAVLGVFLNEVDTESQVCALQVRDCFRPILGHFWCFWCLFSAFLAVFGINLVFLGLFWDKFGVFWVCFGCVLGDFETFLNEVDTESQVCALQVR
jgi:hypothetical protein